MKRLLVALAVFLALVAGISLFLFEKCNSTSWERTSESNGITMFRRTSDQLGPIAFRAEARVLGQPHEVAVILLDEGRSNAWLPFNAMRATVKQLSKLSRVTTTTVKFPWPLPQNSFCAFLTSEIIPDGGTVIRELPPPALLSHECAQGSEVHYDGAIEIHPVQGTLESIVSVEANWTLPGRVPQFIQTALLKYWVKTTAVGIRSQMEVNSPKSKTSGAG